MPFKNYVKTTFILSPVVTPGWKHQHVFLVVVATTTAHSVDARDKMIAIPWTKTDQMIRTYAGVLDRL